MSKYQLFTDGGSRGNPGPAGIGFVVLEDRKLKWFDASFVGSITNNQAEYQALIAGLKYCLKAKIKEIECYLDSELVVKQLNGEYKVKNPNMKPLFAEVTKICDEFNKISFYHIVREKNQFADKLVNIALDAHEA